MIDIDKLTEAQVRYILKKLIKFQWSDDISDDIMVATEQDDYPQQTNNEDQSMTNNNNQVNWDEIPDDVEAVLTYGITESTFFKKIEDKLYSQCWRHSIYKKSGWDEYSEIIDYFGDRFHLRPSPITQPTPVTPESTQVESSEVEATTPPEFDWSSVEEDVEAVITYKGKCKQLLKTVEGVLKYQRVGELEYTTSCWYSTLDEREKYISHYKDGTATLIRRPPAPTTPEDIGLNAAYGTYTKEVERIDIDMVSMKGTIHFKPDADMYDIFRGVGSKPSILTILQEAQQSILKHHGVTGKVKFTVTCSE